MGAPGGGVAGGVPAFMLGGVGGRDAASGGQTKEHAQLAKSLGVDQLAVVISKLDTCDYSQVGAGGNFLWGGGRGGVSG